jgi:surface antigen
MTEREIPDGMGFLFGGMTDASIPQSAPPVLSEPENRVTPVYSSRREARAAGGFSSASSMDAALVAAAQPEAPAQPAYDGIASLFPLLGDVISSPLTTDVAAPSAFEAILAPPPADLGATQAIPAAEVAAELSTPVAPYVVPQSAPVPVVRSWHTPDASVAAVFPDSVSAATPPAPAADPFVAARRQHAAPATPSGRQRQSSRGRSSGRANGGSNGRASDRKTARDAEAKPLRQRLFGVGVMVAVGGLFAVLAIPAYANSDAAALHSAAAVDTQKLTVANAAASTVTTTGRDSYTATSASDLRSLYAAAIREQNIAAYLQSGAKAKGDDYPWFAELSRNQGGGLSKLGYYYRECVDFVAWRLNRDAGTTSAPFRWTWGQLTPNGGDARQWKSAWLAHGWATGTTPVPGAVAWFSANHVAYVNGILDNGQVLIEEYNYDVSHEYDTRVINAGDAYYLYAPPK